MALSEIDDNLLKRCLARKPRAWEDFADRFVGLVIHVINYTAQSRSIRLSNQDREDLAAEVFLEIIENDFAVLRAFRGQSNLATYLTVVARRVVVRELLKNRTPATIVGSDNPMAAADASSTAAEDRIRDKEQVEALMEGLNAPESEVVRLFHLEGKSYSEISQQVGIPQNSIGPTLSRARSKMRQVGLKSA